MVDARVVEKDVNTFLERLAEIGDKEAKLTSVKRVERKKNGKVYNYIFVYFNNELLQEELILNIDSEISAYEKVSNYILGFWNGLRIGERQCLKR